MSNGLQTFLEDEISDQAFYDGIIEFILSGNIRCGEYEGNVFVIKKLDLTNFIIFAEYIIDAKREIGNPVAIQKKQLVSVINRYAKKQGFSVKYY